MLFFYKIIYGLYLRFAIAFVEGDPNIFPNIAKTGILAGKV
jgi:hypothetical protein